MSRQQGQGGTANSAAVAKAVAAWHGNLLAAARVGKTAEVSKRHG